MSDRGRVDAMELANWKPAFQYWRERAEKAEAEASRLKQSLNAKLSDHINGTPCAAIRWQHEKEGLQAEIARLTAEIEVGK